MCLALIGLSSKHNLNKRFLNECKGKQLSFKELADKLKVSSTEANNACAQITTPASVNYDSDDEQISDIFSTIIAAQEEKEKEFGYQEFTVEFSLDMIPVYAELAKTAAFA